MIGYRRVRPAVLAVAVVTLCATVGGPAHAEVPCDDPKDGEVVFAAPFVHELARIAAYTYWGKNPTQLSTAAKSTEADRAITRGVENSWLLIVSNAAADGFRTERLETAAKIIARAGEVARTDKQQGASSTVSGASNVANKTSFASIIDWAVEHGAVQREKNGTSTTLSTTPYALFLLGNEDSDYNFNHYQLLRRLGVAGTFDLDESKSDGSGDFNAKKLSALTTSVRIWGDRSPRTTEFYDLWNAGIARGAREHAQAEVDVSNAVLRKPEAMAAPPAQIKSLMELHNRFASDTAPGPMRTKVRELLLQSSSPEDAFPKIDAALRADLCADIIVPIKTGQLDATGIPQADAIANATKGLVTLDQVQQDLQALQEDFNQRPVVSFKHTWNRSNEGTDYSNFVLAADGEFGRKVDLPLFPITVLLNATLSLNHDPDSSKKQDTLRDVGITGSLSKSMPNPLQRGTDAESAQRMEFALTGRFAHQEDVNADIGVVQGRLSVPLVKGFGLSLALNYNTRTETDSNDEVRVSASVDFNGDTLASLQTLQSLLAGVRH